jgi:hypothetical protein
MQEIRLENWALEPCIHPRTGERLLRVVGEATSHPLFGPSRLHTSPVVKLTGDRVVTRSGSVYLLGRKMPWWQRAIRAAVRQLHKQMRTYSLKS